MDLLKIIELGECPTPRSIPVRETLRQLPPRITSGLIRRRTTTTDLPAAVDRAVAADRALAPTPPASRQSSLSPSTTPSPHPPPPPASFGAAPPGSFPGRDHSKGALHHLLELKLSVSKMVPIHSRRSAKRPPLTSAHRNQKCISRPERPGHCPLGMCDPQRTDESSGDDQLVENVFLTTTMI